MMQGWLCTAALLPSNALALFFLSVRWGLLRAALNAVLGACRRLDSWVWTESEAAFASEYLLNVRWVSARGWERRVRHVLAASLGAAALLLTALLGAWALPGAVFACALKDVLAVLTSGEPNESFEWAQDRYGLPVGTQPSRYRKHVAITGGVSLAAYTTGVLHAMFERYGVAAFSDCDFAGASSGSWTAACATFAANGCRDMHQLFELIFVTACQLTELYPLGLVFLGCEAVEEVASWAMRIAEAEWRSAHDAVALEGKLVVWLFGYSLQRRLFGPRHPPQAAAAAEAGAATRPGGSYRLVVREGGDLQRDTVGSLVLATSVFPFFTHPGLCSRLSCAPAVMDGYFPGKGSGFLPVPDLALPAKGNMLLFDMSGGMKEVYRDEKHVWVLTIKDWRDFKFEDWTASSPEAFRGLFANGVRDAEARWEELDAVMWAAFGAKPRSERK